MSSDSRPTVRRHGLKQLRFLAIWDIEPTYQDSRTCRRGEAIYHHCRDITTSTLLLQARSMETIGQEKQTYCSSQKICTINSFLLLFFSDRYVSIASDHKLKDIPLCEGRNSQSLCLSGRLASLESSNSKVTLNNFHSPT